MTVFYNADLVRQAGGDPDNLPSTWKGITALAKKIDALGKDFSGIYFDYGAGNAIAFQSLVFSQGGSMMNPDETRVTFDGPQGRWAMDIIQGFGNAGQINMSRQQARQMFSASKLGIYHNTSSNLGNFDRQIAGAFPYVMTPVPVAEGGRTPAAGNGMIMFAQSPEQQKAAWKYIKFAAGPEAQAIMAKMTGYVPINHKVIENPEMKAFYRSHPNYAVPLAQIDGLTAWYAFPGQNSEKIARQIMNEMENVVTLRKTASEGLTHAAEETRRLLDLK